MSPIPEVFATHPAAAVVDRDVIVATGDDAERFLQGQLSQDIAALSLGQSAWSLLLHPQGKVAAWLRVTRTDSGFRLDLDAGGGAVALARLERFKLRTACDLALATVPMVAVRGPGAAALGLADAVDPEWPGVDGVDVIGLDAVPAGVAVATPVELEALRIVCGVPSMGAELHDEVIPAEAGVVDRSVSFTKGCYTGQELVARVDSRGSNVPRRLRGLVLDAAPPVGAVVLVDGVERGTVTSLAPVGDGRVVALAYVGRAVDPPSDAVVDGIAAVILPLPLVS